MGLAATILAPPTPDGAPFPADQLDWVRSVWVPKVDALVAELAPLRLPPGSPEEMQAVQRFWRIIREPIARVGLAPWLRIVENGGLKALAESIQREQKAADVTRKLALRWVQSAVETLLSLVPADQLAKLAATDGTRSANDALPAVPPPGSIPEELSAGDVNGFVPVMATFVALSASEGGIADLAYWALRAFRSAQTLVGRYEEHTRAFARWKGSLVQDDGILGGALVFPRTRLAVRRIGELLSNGHEAEVREDYPYLNGEDLVFARMLWDVERLHAAAPTPAR